MLKKHPTFTKVLVANRGEIAIRIFRACTELGVRTVAVYSHADLLSIHRYKADEAYMIGDEGDSVAAYLDGDAIIEVAQAVGADAIHPGYGFLSENEDFAKACAQAGITFIGPRPDTLGLLSDKTSARRVAIEAGVPVIPGTQSAVENAEAVSTFAQTHGFPIILKAAFGGGGRGMRIIRTPDEVQDAFERASGEARAAFGRGDLFCERFIENAQHIEVQILADGEGNYVHLFERDCSVQRRHQKLIEVAPAVNLGDAVRSGLYNDALRIAHSVDYVNAGTVEFLVEPDGRYYFIEVNPRIQVEHTITEEITGRDLVQAQICIAAGYSLSQTPINIPHQAAVVRQGFAIQCRITTEDPQAGFMPDTGRISTYRAAAGFGIRLDSGTGGAGTDVSADFDTLLVKLTASAITFEAAAQKALRSLREFRIRGVRTNIPFLEKTVTHSTFLSGRATTRFVDETPELLEFAPRKDRASKLLRALANSVVNGPPGSEMPYARPDLLPRTDAPSTPVGPPPMSQAMAVFRKKGADGLAKWLRAESSVALTDTTFRDAHQSLLATRVRTFDLLNASPLTAHFARDLFSLEVWGGATFDVAYRFLRECPWERLHRLRARCPNVLLQMLLRGANAVGYKNYPDNVIRKFVQQAARGGVDIFRIFDALNWLPNMEVAIEEVAREGKIAEATLCYTGDVSSPSECKYTLEYYVKLAKALEERGAHIIAIKDMAGLLKPRAASILVTALRDAVELPVHLHTHDTSGNGIAMLLAAIDAGVDAVDCAVSSMSGLTSQPSMNALVAALDGHARQPAIDQDQLSVLTDHWEAVRELYWPFESGLKASTADVYRHEIPGGQYSNLRPRAIQLGLGDKWGDIKTKYREVNDALGRLVKVTPTSKVVADFAMFLVQNNLSIEECLKQGEKIDFPNSLIDFMSGRLGQPYGGFPEDLQNAVLKGATPLTTRAGLSLEDYDFETEDLALRRDLDRDPTADESVSHSLYPAVFKAYRDYQRDFGRTADLPTFAVLYGLKLGEQILVEIEPGKTLVVKLVAVGGLDEAGLRKVYFELNGHPREAAVQDLSVRDVVARRPKAAEGNDAEVGAAMPGKVVQLCCRVGETVKAGQVLLVTEAMKMETSVSANRDGEIESITVEVGDKVGAGDLLATLV